MEKKSVFWIAFGLSAAEIAVFVVMRLLNAGLRFSLGPLVPSLSEYQLDLLNVGVYLLRDVVMYGTLIFVLWIVIRWLPGMPKLQKSTISFKMFVALFLISAGVSYFISYPASFADSIFTAALKDLYTLLLSPMFGPLPEPSEPSELSSLMKIANLVVVCIFAPVFEELMFRRVLLDKLRPFGDLAAILVCGFTFGLTHLNVSQFLYASFGGFVFSYVMIKTNRLIYPILLHAAYNAISSILFPLIWTGSELAGLTYLGNLSIVGIAFGLSVIGLAMFFTTLKKIKLDRPVFRFSRRVGTGLIMGNVGTILYLVICFGFFTYYAIMS